MKFLSALIFAATLAYAYGGASFCWKDTYTRGVGKIPNTCASGQDRIGLLCYNKCPSNMKRFGFDCHSKCPSGWRDDGLFCRLAEYGRGAGYPWKFGDWFSDKGMYKRCEAAHGRGKCEKWGAVVYPKCKSGFYAFGCCICRPYTPNCGALGLGGRFDISCAKKIWIGSPKLGTCPSGQERDAGLCYPTCKSGYNGVGPVCWGLPPKGWVNCGMGAAVDSANCASAVFNQITSVGMLAMNIVTLGGSSAANSAKSAASAGKLMAQLDKLKKAWNGIKASKNFKKVMDVADKVGKVKAGWDLTQESIVTEADIIRVSATIASLVEPTGIAGVIGAYSYSKCSTYFKS